jgi:hypothetical protein
MSSDFSSTVQNAKNFSTVALEQRPILGCACLCPGLLIHCNLLLRGSFLNFVRQELLNNARSGRMIILTLNVAD